METTENFIDPLLERAEKYGKTNLTILKLKAVEKTAELASGFISNLALIIIASLLLLTLTISAGLWMGDLLGKNYYGFLIVAAFYFVCGSVLILMRKPIKTQIQNSVIKKMLN